MLAFTCPLLLTRSKGLVVDNMCLRLFGRLFPAFKTSIVKISSFVWKKPGCHDAQMSCVTNIIRCCNLNKFVFNVTRVLIYICLFRKHVILTVVVPIIIHMSESSLGCCLFNELKLYCYTANLCYCIGKVN